MNGYRISKQDNDSFAFREMVPDRDRLRAHHVAQGLIACLPKADRYIGSRCAECNNLLDKWNEPLPHLRIRKRRYDLSITYDGVTVASERFTALCEAQRLSGIEFQSLPRDPRFFVVRVTNVVSCDVERSRLRLKNQCASCKQFNSVAGPLLYLVTGATIPRRGFVRTDVEFGGADEKFPILLCGQQVAQVLREAKLRGIFLKPMDK